MKYYAVTHKEHVLCNPTSIQKHEELIRLLTLKKGDKVAVLLENSIEIVEVYLSTAKTGLVIVPINFRLIDKDVGYIADNVRHGLEGPFQVAVCPETGSGQHHRRALGREASRDRPADSPARSGHQCHTPFTASHRFGSSPANHLPAPCI